MARSIERFGFRQPIVVDSDKVIIVGHVRLKAALKLGLKEVPVHVADLTAEQAQAYRLADNRSNEYAVWDEDLLLQELRELSEFAEADLKTLSEMTSFDKTELERFLGPPPGETDPDDIPSVPEPVCKPGDVWALGEHRLMCGDATDAGNVARLLDRATPNLMVTDPPYGVEYDARWRLESGINKQHQTRAEGAVLNDDTSDWGGAYKLFGGDVAYVWHGGKASLEFQRSLEQCKFEVRSQIIWVKTSLVIGRGHYHWQHEPCFYAVRKGARSDWRGGGNSRLSGKYQTCTKPREMSMMAKQGILLKSRSSAWSVRSAITPATCTTPSADPAPPSSPPSARTAPATPWR